MNRAGLILLVFAPVACDLVPRFGGTYFQDTPVAVGAAGSSSVRLVLGQYGPEVAGHLALPDLATCPCVYVRGTTEGDTVRFEPEPTLGCTFVFKRGEFELTSAGLRGRLLRLTASGVDVEPLFELQRQGEQSDLGTHLKGCHE